MPLTALEEVAQISADWLWETDARGRFTHLSAEAERFIGCAPATLIGRSRADLAFDAGADRLQPYRKLLAAREPFRNLVYVYRHPDGAPRWFEISGRPRRSDEGAFLGYRGVGTDVSEEHRTREALVSALAQLRDANGQLTEQNRRFDAALENMTQGLCMFDSDSRLLVWNRRYLDIFGLAADALTVGMPQRAIIEILVALKRYRSGATVESVSEGTRTSLAVDGVKPVLRELADGRVIAATHRPMSGGGWVATFEDVTERRRNEARIIHMARHDALTDLPNRNALREVGTEMLGPLPAAQGQGLAVLCLDLDRFKPVNDSFGHAVGDALLRAVADRLRSHVRPNDLVARLGGDEFAILHRIACEPDAAALARRLIRTISAPYDINGYVIEIGTSVGIAMSGPDASDIDRLLKNADMALYEAKATGRGLHRVFEPQMDATARERLTLERELREALAHGQFELHYQPLVDLAGSAGSAGSRGSRRWCAGVIRSGGSSAPASSSRSRRRRGSSSRSASGC